MNVVTRREGQLDVEQVSSCRCAMAKFGRLWGVLEKKMGSLITSEAQNCEFSVRCS